MRQLIFQIGALIEPGARLRWAALVVLGFLVGLSELVAALLVVLLLAHLTGAAAGSIPFVDQVAELVPGLAGRDSFEVLSAFTAVFFVLRGALYVSQSYVQHRVAHQAGVRISERMLRGYLRMPYAWHLRRNSAEMIRNAHESMSEIVGYVFVPGVNVISESMVALSIGGLILVAAPALAGGVAVTLLPFTIALVLILRRHLSRFGAVNQEMIARSLKALQQSLHGVREIKVFGREDYFLEQFAAARRTQARAQYLRATLSEVPRIAVETFVIALILIGLSVTGAGEKPGELLAVLGLFGYAAMRLMPALNRVVTNINLLRFGLEAVKLVSTDLMEVEGAPSGRSAFTSPVRLKESIELRGVSFRHEGSATHTVNDVDLVVKQGAFIGIAGPTGGGKTTLIDLITGLLTPTSGAVYVDGVAVHSQTDAWQANLGVVPQTLFLLDDSLRRNIAFGVPDTEIDETALRTAVQRAQLDSFVAGLPTGLDTVVGERGVRVSGGQRQRVALARALYRDPAVLVFDEGTSALDTATETALMEALQALRGSRTLILVAHRLSTLRECDEILLVADGRITDRGDFASLSAGSAAFRSLAGLQP